MCRRGLFYALYLSYTKITIYLTIEWILLSVLWWHIALKRTSAPHFIGCFVLIPCTSIGSYLLKNYAIMCPGESNGRFSSQWLENVGKILFDRFSTHCVEKLCPVLMYRLPPFLFPIKRKAEAEKISIPFSTWCAEGDYFMPLRHTILPMRSLPQPVLPMQDSTETLSALFCSP